MPASPHNHNTTQQSPSSPKVSLCVAAYNIEEYIEKCLQSLVEQTLREIEIIVVNDGSTDDTLEKIQSLAQQDARIRIINQQNQGIINVRRVGFEVATGEYIQFVDGDDWLDPSACEPLYQQAKKEQADVLLFHYQEAFAQENGSDDFNMFKQLTDTQKGLDSDAHPFIASTHGELGVSLCTKLIRRQFLVEKNLEFPKNIAHGEDHAFSNILYLNQPRMAFCGGFYYYYRQRRNSAVRNLQGYVDDCEQIISCINKHANSIQVTPVIKAYVDFSNLIYLLHLHIRLLESGDKALGKQVEQKILHKKIVLSQSIEYKTVWHKIWYQLYRLSPRLFLLMRRGRFYFQAQMRKN